MNSPSSSIDSTQKLNKKQRTSSPLPEARDRSSDANASVRTIEIQQQLEQVNELRVKFQSLKTLLEQPKQGDDVLVLDSSARQLPAIYDIFVQQGVSEAGVLLHKLCLADTLKEDEQDGDGGGDEQSHSQVSLPIRELISFCPEALAHKNEADNLPISLACLHSDNKRGLVVYLAQKAIEHEVFPDDMRGGLLCLNCNIHVSALDIVCCYYDEDGEYLKALKDLISLNLVSKADIDKSQIFAKGMWSKQEQFDFLADWHPKGLKVRYPAMHNPNSSGNLPIHHGLYYMLELNSNSDLIPEECRDIAMTLPNEPDFFRLVLRAGMRHYPRHFGFLFGRSESGATAFHLAVKTDGLKKTMSTIRECIPPEEQHSHILHKVLKHAPEHFNAFIGIYPDWVFDKGDNGRLLLHSALAFGVKLSGELMLTLNTPQTAIAEKDPITGLYPFMLASRGSRSDLNTAYYLVRRDPTIYFCD